MAIKVTETRYGRRYLALYRTTDGKQKSAGTFATKRLAEAAYLEAKAKVLRGIDPSAPVETVHPAQVGGQETVSSFAERWLPNHDVTDSVRLTCGYYLGRHVIPVLGARPMAEIGTPDVAQLLRAIDKLGRPAVTAKVKTVMSAMFRAAAHDKSTGVRGQPGQGRQDQASPAQAQDRLHS